MVANLPKNWFENCTILHAFLPDLKAAVLGISKRKVPRSVTISNGGRCLLVYGLWWITHSPSTASITLLLYSSTNQTYAQANCFKLINIRPELVDAVGCMLHCWCQACVRSSEGNPQWIVAGSVYSDTRWAANGGFQIGEGILQRLCGTVWACSEIRMNTIAEWSNSQKGNCDWMLCW